MATDKQRPAIDARREISRLMEAAAREGGADLYLGKRGTRRFAQKMQLEVTTDPNDPAATWAVTMHNISERGFAFWSRRALGPGTFICMREFSGHKTRPWIPARIRYGAVGVRGHLMGAVFEVRSQKGPAAAHQASAGLPQPVGLRSRGFRR